MQWTCNQQLFQFLHFVVFLFLDDLAAEDEPAAAELLGDKPAAAAELLFFFLTGRAGEWAPRVPEDEDLPPVPE